MGVEQSTCGVAPLPTLTPSPAVTDITENMRAKIYALCCKMGEGMFILTDFKLLLNTCSYFACACVGFQYTMEGLPTEDRVTLCIVESYAVNMQSLVLGVLVDLCENPKVCTLSLRKSFAIPYAYNKFLRTYQSGHA